MKTILIPKRNQCGSVLVVGLVITFILGVTLASYLLMTRGHNLSVVRSQTWNSAFALTEAGVEDAMAMLNKNSGNFEKLREWTNSASLSADNWATLSGNVYHARRNVGPNYYDVYITNLNNQATIRSIGTIAWNYSYASAPQGLLAAVGVSSPSTSASLSRKVEVKTKVDAIFNFAMAAEKAIDLNGKKVATDSFDSVIPEYNTGGLYDKNKSKDNGDVVTNDIITGALDVGNGKIKGLVKTGPRGKVDIGPSGSVGDKAWVDGGNVGIQDGHFADDMNVVWDPVALPSGSDANWVPAIGNPSVLYNYTTNGSTYNYVFTRGGDYYLHGSTLNKGIYIVPNISVRIWIYSGSVSLTANTDEIRIAANSDLRLYMSGTTFTIGGKGVVNEGGNAANFYYYGMTSNRGINFIGNGSFTGAIYAPNADFALGGGGNDEYDFVGASVTRKVQMNGHFKFHYDENLRRVGPGRGYIPTDWKES